jgi:hypothetical protein
MKFLLTSLRLIYQEEPQEQVLLDRLTVLRCATYLLAEPKGDNFEVKKYSTQPFFYELARLQKTV